MKSLADLDYDALHARAVLAARLPALDDDGDDFAGLDVVGDETFAGYGTIAVTADPWLRERANAVLQGLPDLPRPIDALRTLDGETLYLVLFTALYEISVEHQHLRAFDPGKHRRWPKGHPLAGKFRPMVDMLKQAILDFDPKKDRHPFELFTRPQLLKVAKDRGIALKRGEDRDSIAAKLLKDLGGTPAQPKPTAPAAPTNTTGFKLDPADRLRVKVLPFVGGSWPGKKESHQIHVGNKQIGAIHQEQDDTWTAKPLGPGEPYFVAPPKNANRDQAIKALLDAHDAAANKSAGGSSATNAPHSNDPAVNAALDVLYGRDPKARTAARQLVVYGALRRNQFDQLDPAERSTLLGDLSYIMSTSKNASTVGRAQTLFGRFTPAGTPFAHVPAQMGIVPNLATGPGQTSFPDPGGVKGMLRKSKNPGQSGDGWMRLTNGGTGPWGKYGAAGLLLRHVDKKGEERYLMVQRGPAISDPGKWQFPGGAIDSKETMAEGATREVVEELGFQYSDFADAGVHGFHEATVPGATGWKYTSFAATVPTKLKPDLSTHHAQMETADAKWMTLDEIRRLDSGGKLLKPLAGGALERNVVSLFPSKGTKAGVAVGGSGPVTTKPSRLQGGTAGPSAPVALSKPHKPSTGRNLIGDKAAQDKLRTDVAAVRKSYRGKTADERLAAIGAMQGYDATPTVATKAEMDRLLATGDYIEAWRGVSSKAGKSAAEINETMRSGTAFYGLGVFGNGYYLATDKALAQAYSDRSKGSLLRVLIPKAAKTNKHKDVEKKARSATSSTSFYHQGRQSMGGGTLHDEGRFAAAAGLDGIEISKDDYRFKGGYGHLATGPVYNWVNRSVLIIQEA